VKPNDENGRLPTRSSKMEVEIGQPRPTLVFVYNAESGLLNALTDTAHKVFSPRTYHCNLCALTYSTFGIHNSWKRFLATLDRPLEFLHADELQNRYGISGIQLPAIFNKTGERLELLINANSINKCQTIDELKQLVKENLS
jgi:hypothetical protein